MHLYSLPLVPSSSITCAVVGQFSGTKTQEIVLIRGANKIELIRPDTNQGKAVSIFKQDAFGRIRSASSFRLTGGGKGESCFFLTSVRQCISEVV